MTAPLILTAQDCFEYGIFYQEGHSKSAHQQMLGAALHSAYMELGQEFDWAFLWKQGRLHLQEPVTTGTATYDHTGGFSERLVTFSSAVLTSSMNDWSLRIDGVPCRLESILSTTQATLEATMNPGRDVAAGASYRLYPGYYVLPNDFKRIVQPRAEVAGWSLQELSYDDILTLERDYDETGTPLYYCTRGIEDLYGSMGMWIHPASDDTKTMDFMYERRSREIRHTGHRSGDRAGTITVTSGSAAVTGSGTSFASSMVGSILRIAGSTTAPTGWRGSTPYEEQRSIIAVSSTTALTLDANVSTSRSAVAYTISDPVDIDPTLHQVLLDGMIRQLAYMQNWDDRERIQAKYLASLAKAKAANSSGGRRVMGGGTVARRIKDIATYPGDS